MAKNSKEKNIFDKFIKHFNNVEVVDIEGESPDFLINYCDDLIGIEHTDMYWENSNTTYPFQEMESLRSSINSKLQSKLEASNLPSVFVSLFFNKNQKLHKLKVDDLSSRLMTIIEDNIPKIGSSIKFDESSGCEVLPLEIVHMEINRLQGIDFFEVSSPTTSFLPKLTQNIIQRTISRKEKKLLNYYKRAKKQWLLISIETGSMATIYSHFGSPELLSFDSKFDKVILFWFNQNRVIELKLGY